MAKMNYPAASHQEHKAQVSAKRELQHINEEGNAQLKIPLDSSAGWWFYCKLLIFRWIKKTIMQYSSTDFHNPCPDVRILTSKNHTAIVGGYRGWDPISLCLLRCMYGILYSLEGKVIWWSKSIGPFKSLLIQEENLLSKRTWICTASPKEELQAHFELNCTFRWQSTCSGSTLTEEMVFLPHPWSGRRGKSKFPYRKGVA